MQTYLDLLFITNVAFIITHELDAIRQGEWRFFFAPTNLSDQHAYRIFTALHVPLFVLIIWNLNSFPFQVGFDIFLMVHAGLHWLLREHPLIDFNNGFSRFWIFGGSLLGALHIILLWV
ncbi:MAG: hypothetical protein DWQ07_06715 [Chloroflexi bacterium]|nr:MAG: hypothetical protein DWQ07_06715 [Chloroflexota bacterium]MBL1195608.1 hypothetical protein [Chloroflexota bacterium]NOH12895.1 hypothetical protein [Chloroflexota bacterium]